MEHIAEFGPLRTKWLQSVGDARRGLAPANNCGTDPLNYRHEPNDSCRYIQIPKSTRTCIALLMGKYNHCPIWNAVEEMAAIRMLRYSLLFFAYWYRSIGPWIASHALENQSFQLDPMSWKFNRFILEESSTNTKTANSDIKHVA